MRPEIITDLADKNRAGYNRGVQHLSDRVRDLENTMNHTLPEMLSHLATKAELKGVEGSLRAEIKQSALTQIRWSLGFFGATIGILVAVTGWILSSQWRMEERLDARMDRIEYRMDKMDDRFDRLEQRLDLLERRFDLLERQVSEIRDLIIQSQNSTPK